MKRRDIRRGFSFIEIIIAMIILSALATFLAFTIPHDYTVTQDTQDVLKANDLAKKYIEQVKYQLKAPAAYDAVLEGSTSPVPVTSEINAGGYFTVTTNVSFVGRTGREDTLKEIDVVFKKTGTASVLMDISTIIIKPESSV